MIPPREPQLLAFVAGIAFLLMSVWVFREAAIAYAHHTLIPARGGRFAWMLPIQGFAAGVLLLCIAYYCFVTWVASIRRKR